MLNIRKYIGHQIKILEFKYLCILNKARPKRKKNTKKKLSVFRLISFIYYKLKFFFVSFQFLLHLIVLCLNSRPFILLWLPYSNGLSISNHRNRTKKTDDESENKKNMCTHLRYNTNVHKFRVVHFN